MAFITLFLDQMEPLTATQLRIMNAALISMDVGDGMDKDA